MKTLVALMLAAAFIPAPPAVSEDVLEPSVANEVEHALDRAPADLPPAAADFAVLAAAWPTNGLSRNALAIRLVSAQGADGRWRSGTNDVTAAAAAILRGL